MRLLAITLLAAGLALPLFVRAQESYGDTTAPVAGQALGTVIHTRDAEELRYVILQRLTDRYAAERGITVTQAEKDAYVHQMRQRMQADRERQHVHRDKLARQLAAEGLSPAQRQALANELDAVERFLAALGGPSPAADPDEVTARQEIAAAFIRQWKINGALYRQYGGRIVFQQGGPEPLDAYRSFLKERCARGEFEIANPTLETAFWRYYLDDSMHSFYPAGSREAALVFEAPPWLATPAN